ncbi:MAG: 23S rRNA (guanosine(2251)-2'-O)-methyltransferase RlmB [Desulfohalobiaceae bacterium]
MESSVVAGKRAVQEAVQNAPETIEAVYLQEEKGKALEGVVRACRKMGIKCQTVPRAKLDALTELKHQGVAAKVFPPGFRDGTEMMSLLQQAELPLLIALDHVQDQGNVGSLARTGCAVGLAGIVLTKDRSASLGSRAIKSSAGALERLPVGRVVNMARFIRDCRKENISTYYAGTDEGCHNLYSETIRLPAVLVLGNEEKGVRPGVATACDYGLSIPMPGGFNSLNVAQAGGMMLGEMLRQRMLEGNHISRKK